MFFGEGWRRLKREERKNQKKTNKNKKLIRTRRVIQHNKQQQQQTTTTTTNNNNNKQQQTTTNITQNTTTSSSLFFFCLLSSFHYLLPHLFLTCLPLLFEWIDMLVRLFLDHHPWDKVEENNLDQRTSNHNYIHKHCSSPSLCTMDRIHLLLCLDLNIFPYHKLTYTLRYHYMRLDI